VPVDVTVGWDSVRETISPQVEDQMAPQAEPETGLVLWLDHDVGVIHTVEDLGRALASYATLPAALRDRLERDRVNDLLGSRT
jgi:hypothetical protein